MEILFLFFIVYTVVLAYAGHEIGARKGRATEGLALGLVLGLIGVIVVYMLPVKELPDYGDESRGRLCLVGGPRHVYEDGWCVDCGVPDEEAADG
jgi:hypothetical protein